MLRIGLARTGLSPYFRWVISAGEVKLYKPSPKVYRLAVQHMRLPKDEILFVSSNPFDVAGAKSFGFSVCWINRTGSPFDPLGRKPDLILSNLEGLGARLS
jgi:2-haloacid dehalogenase